MARIYKRKGADIWWIGYRLPGDVNERRESSKSTNKKTAERLLKARTIVGGEAKAPRKGRMTVNAICDALEVDYALHERKSIRDTSYHLRAIRRLLGSIPGIAVTHARLVAYAAIRKREGVSSSTINREFAALRRGMRVVFQDTGITLPTFPTFSETNVRQGTYTREEIESLVSFLPAHVVPVVWFAYYTGRRRGEILGLRWEQVQWETGILVVSPALTKHQRPDIVVLEGELHDLLRSLWIQRNLHCPWIFPYKGNRFRTFHKVWKKARIAAGLPNKLFHDIRRTTSTDLIEAGVPEQVAMRITGHRTRATFDRYHIVKTTATREALIVLEQYRNRGQSGDSDVAEAYGSRTHHRSC